MELIIAPDGFKDFSVDTVKKLLILTTKFFELYSGIQSSRDIEIRHTVGTPECSVVSFLQCKSVIPNKRCLTKHRVQILRALGLIQFIFVCYHLLLYLFYKVNKIIENQKNH